MAGRGDGAPAAKQVRSGALFIVAGAGKVGMTGRGVFMRVVIDPAWAQGENSEKIERACQAYWQRGDDGKFVFKFESICREFGINRLVLPKMSQAFDDGDDRRICPECSQTVPYLNRTDYSSGWAIHPACLEKRTSRLCQQFRMGLEQETEKREARDSAPERRSRREAALDKYRIYRRYKLGIEEHRLSVGDCIDILGEEAGNFADMVTPESSMPAPPELIKLVEDYASR